MRIYTRSPCFGDKHIALAAVIETEQIYAKAGALFEQAIKQRIGAHQAMLAHPLALILKSPQVGQAVTPET